MILTELNKFIINTVNNVICKLSVPCSMYINKGILQINVCKYVSESDNTERLTLVLSEITDARKRGEGCN